MGLKSFETPLSRIKRVKPQRRHAAAVQGVAITRGRFAPVSRSVLPLPFGVRAAITEADTYETFVGFGEIVPQGHGADSGTERDLQKAARVRPSGTLGGENRVDAFPKTLTPPSPIFRSGNPRVGRAGDFSERERHSARARRTDQRHCPSAGADGSWGRHPHLRANGC